MSNEPTERDVEVLAGVLQGLAFADPREDARAVLASDWYAERIAQAYREGAAEALSDAAYSLEGRLGVEGTPRDLWEFRQWLRERAAALRGDA